MSSNSCKRLLIQILPKLVLGMVLVFFTQNLVAHTCGTDAHYGSVSTTDSATGGVPSGVWVKHVRERNSLGYQRFLICQGSTYYRITAPGHEQNGIIFGANHWYTTCGDGSGTDNATCSHHVEYRDGTNEAWTGQGITCDDGCCSFTCVKNEDVDCKNYPLAFAGAGQYGINNNTWTRTSQNGYMTYSICDANNYVQRTACYSWNTGQCYLSKTGYTHGKCTGANARLPANNPAEGNAYDGFFIKYDLGNIIYTCSECPTGYKIVNVAADYDELRDGCLCDVVHHWDCPSSGDARCYPGYQQNGSGSSATCTQKPHYYCYGDNSNTCVCEFGFDRNYDCQRCKPNFEYHSDSDSCVCPDGFRESGRDDPENDTEDSCDLDTTQFYVDATGWFKLSSDGSNMCHGTWWEQENNN